MFENNTDRMFWTIAVLILGATLLTIGNKAFPKVQDSIMSTMSQNIKTANNSADNLAKSITNDDSDAQKRKDFAEFKNYTYNYNADGTINLLKYKGSATNIEIPKYGPAQNSSDIENAVKVTHINRDNIEDGTYENKNITSVKIPDSIQYIGEYAFYKNNLTNVELPNSLTTIGYGAFWNNQLTSLNIPNSVTVIQGYAFTANKLTTLKIPNSVTDIRIRAFIGNQLTSVEIPNSVTSIGTQAFSDNNIASVNVPNSVTTTMTNIFDSSTKINRTN